MSASRLGRNTLFLLGLSVLFAAAAFAQDANVIVNAFEVDRAGNVVPETAMLLNGQEAGIGDAIDSGLLTNNGAQTLIVAISSGEVLRLIPGETVLIAGGGAEQVRKCVCFCGTEAKKPQGVTTSEGCQALNGKACLDSAGVKHKYTECEITWVDA